MESIKIKIATDFSYSPGPRYIKEGKHSGELFRQQLLSSKIKEAIQSNKELIVDLDGTNGYGTSFLEESFGGLIRIDKIEYESIVKILKIISKEEDYLEEDVLSYMKDASEEQ